MIMNEKIITLFGSSQPKEGEPAYRSAYDLGFALATAGWTVCNGGYGGTMEAAAKGAKDAGGSTIGVTCTIFGRSGPNPYLDRVIETCDLFTRLTQLIELGQAYVVLPGGSGTLVELAIVWELIAKRLMAPKPAILLGNFWKTVIETAALERPKSKNTVAIAENIPHVLELLAKSNEEKP
jgi:uncharacterized protein (TIGR00730 family)